jgi:hypothetical protein
LDSRRHQTLLPGVSAFAVDFVIPRIGVDLPVGIDPFLLYKSRDPRLADLHTLLMRVFTAGIEAVKREELDEARRLLQFPEPPEIGFGYTRRSKRGSGLGGMLTDLLIDTLVASPRLLERGIRHVEEMQLVSIGVGPDRISDIAANVLKRELIEYTQKQAGLWNIELQAGVPVEHYFDAASGEWRSGHFDLPVNPESGEPIILVPRRIVRTLPWINYGDFLRSEFVSVLKGRSSRVGQPQDSIGKRRIVAISRNEVERIEHYVRTKERAADQAAPSRDYLADENECADAEALKRRLSAIQPGTAQAADYQHLILEILNLLFNPDLIDGELEVRTAEGTERRDIMFTNDSDESFWTYVRTEHSGIFLMFETKNTSDLDNMHINQTATYLGDRLGRLGFVVTRQPLAHAQMLKLFSVYNDSQPRKVILVLTDADITAMLDLKCKGESPMRYIQRFYRKFRTSVQ